MECSDAVYIRSCPSLHYEQVKYALEKGKHVLCESPIALSQKECKELFSISKKRRKEFFLKELKRHTPRRIIDLYYLLKQGKSEILFQLMLHVQV